MSLLFGNGASPYGEANEEMLAAFQKTHRTDGEMTFFAVDPERLGQGIGTVLLEALESELSGKTLFLYTDTGCTWQFYEHRGYERAQQRQIVLDLHEKRVPLTCFLYGKTIE